MYFEERAEAGRVLAERLVTPVVAEAAHGEDSRHARTVGVLGA